MTRDDLRGPKRATILKLAADRGARNVRVFGSVARGGATPLSDVDFLVDLDPGRSLMDLGGLLMDLRDTLGIQVDIATPSMLRAHIRERALRDATPL
jgi:predicted nucleotidyltransferase